MNTEQEERKGLVRKRIAFKCEQDIPSDSLLARGNWVDVRSNAATLLKEVAVILKEEEEETKKLLDLMIGSPNYKEYEKMIEERLAEEKELFRLKIEKLHLEGKLTDKAAILAKQRLLSKSKERRKLFEEERRRYLEDVERLKVIEKERALCLFSKVKEINKRAQFQKQHLLATKKSEGQKNRENIQNLLKEAIARGKEEYKKKVMIIKEVRAFEALKKSLSKKSKNKKKESPKIGLLCEMTLEELAARKALVQALVKEEQCRRRKEIIQKIKNKEMFLDEAEKYVNDIRRRRKLQKLAKETNKDSTEKKLTSFTIPSTFLRPIPPVTDHEATYKRRLNSIIELKKHKKESRIQDIKRSRKLCYIQSKKECDKLNRILEGRFSSLKTGKHNSLHYIIPGKFCEPLNSRNEDSLRKMITVKTHDKQSQGKEKRTIKLTDDKYSSLSEYMEMINWTKFKHFLASKTHYKLPKRFQNLTHPPFDWSTKKYTENKLEKIKWSIDRIRVKRSSLRRTKRTLSFYGPKITKYKRTKPKYTSARYSEKKRRDRKWAYLWKWFNITILDESKSKFQGLEKLQDPYAKNIIAKVNYFYNIPKKKLLYLQTESLNPRVEKSKEEVALLKTKLKEMTESIGNKQRITQKRHKEYKQIFSKPLVLPSNHQIIEDSVKCRKYIQEIPDHFIARQVLAEEDNEIKETPLERPIRRLQQINSWSPKKEPENSSTQEVPEESISRPVLKAWQVVRKQKKSVHRNREPPLEYKLLTEKSEKYTLLRNSFGQPVFTLRPLRSDHMVWEWVPVVVRKEEPIPQYPTVANMALKTVRQSESSKGDVELSKALEQIKAFNTAAMDFIKKNVKSYSLLPKMLAYRYLPDDKYLHRLRGKSRQKYFLNVPIRMILDNWKTHQYGGEPNKTPPLHAENAETNI